MAKVAQPVVDRRSSEHEQCLWSLGVVEQPIEPIVSGRLHPSIGIATTTRIAEVMRLINQNDVGKLRDSAEAVRKVALATKVCVAEDRQVAKISVPADAANMWEPLS